MKYKVFLLLEIKSPDMYALPWEEMFWDAKPTNWLKGFTIVRYNSRAIRPCSTTIFPAHQCTGGFRLIQRSAGKIANRKFASLFPDHKSQGNNKRPAEDLTQWTQIRHCSLLRPGAASYRPRCYFFHRSDWCGNSIVSLSCTGPILGSLLVGSLRGGAWPLTAGLAWFGIALGLPYGLFATFPNLLKSLPKSGGWLDTLKKVLAFIEVALRSNSYPMRIS